MNVLMVMEEECLVGEKIIVRVSERKEEESFASGECVVVCIVAERWWARERERERASRRSVCSVGIVGGAYKIGRAHV